MYILYKTPKCVMTELQYSMYRKPKVVHDIHDEYGERVCSHRWGNFMFSSSCLQSKVSVFQDEIYISASTSIGPGKVRCFVVGCGRYMYFLNRLHNLLYYLILIMVQTNCTILFTVSPIISADRKGDSILKLFRKWKPITANFPR